MMVFWAVLAVMVGVMGYVRLAPSDPGRWHVMPDIAGDKDFQSGVIRVIAAGPDGVRRLDQVIQATPRTSVLAGSAEAGFVTYVTRTAAMGFPDYTTLRQDGDRAVIYGRSRFGRSDLGVNRTRVEAWIDALQL